VRILRIIITHDEEEMSRRAAAIAASQVTLKPDSVLALPAGSTPLGMYRDLVRLQAEGRLDFSGAAFFSLDEYCGLGREDSQSYGAYMDHHFYRPVNARAEQVNILDGLAHDAQAECRRYEEKIKLSGGIDLLVMGIGSNGHIGFNEPGSGFVAETHVVQLDPATIAANAIFFPAPEAVPTRAISMGIRTILQSRMILLLASGEAKAAAVKEAVRGLITPRLPASVIQLHRDVVLILEKNAARLL